MSTFKITIKRGQKSHDVTVAAGTSITGSDAMELNIDVTALNKGEARVLLKEIDAYIQAHGWPEL